MFLDVITKELGRVAFQRLVKLTGIEKRGRVTTPNQ